MSLLQCSAAAVLGAALSLSLRTADAPEEEPTDYGVPHTRGRSEGEADEGYRRSQVLVLNV